MAGTEANAYGRPETLGPIGYPSNGGARPVLFARQRTYHTDLTQFYNDAYISFLGASKHLGALGQSARKCWREIWHIIVRVHKAFA